MNDTLEKRRIKWACRRGMLELDLYLMPYFENQYDTLSPHDQEAFCRLLECADTDIYYWINGKEQSEDLVLMDICIKIRQFHAAFCK